MALSDRAAPPGVIDWTTRPRLVRVAPQREYELGGGPGTTGGNWTIVPRAPGTILTADIYNADRQAVIDNFTPPMLDDYSTTLAEMQAETNPYPGGAPSQAVSLAGELERMRFVLHQLNPGAPAWYAAVSAGLAPASLTLPDGGYLRGTRTDGGLDNLIGLSANQLFIGTTLPLTATVYIGGPAGLVQSGGYFHLKNSFSLATHLADNATWLSLIYCDSGNTVRVAEGLPGGQVLALHAYETQALGGKLSVGAGYVSGWNPLVEIDAHENNVPSLTFHRRNVKAWSIGIDGTNGLYFGDGFGPGAPKVVVSAAGGLVIPPGQWYGSGTRALLSFDGANTLVGGYAPGIILTADTTVSGHMAIAGTLSVGGVPVIGTGLRAFARGDTLGNAFTAHNITHWGPRQGPGIIDVQWTPPLGAPCVTVSCEASGILATCQLVDASSARITCVTVDTAPVDAIVNVMICGN